jgi:uncharacterized protein YfdQ (DUF2303 family)
MKKDAIQHISSEAVANAKLLDEKTNTPAIALPGDMKIHSLESYMEKRSRYRGNFDTSYIADFVNYLEKHTNDDCFIDPNSMSAKTFFNLGDKENPGHGDHTAKLVLKRTAPFNEILNINDQPREQRKISEWLEDWREYLTAIDQEKKSIDIKTAIASVRKITIEEARTSEHSEENFSSTKSAMEKIEAKSANGIPAGFNFKCTPHEGLKEREFYMRLSITTGGDEPRFTLRIAMLDAIKEEMANEFKDVLIGELGADSGIFIGAFESGK